MKAFKANILDYLDGTVWSKGYSERKETHRKQDVMTVEVTVMCFEDGGRSHKLMNGNSL